MSPIAWLLVRGIDRYRRAGGGRRLFWVDCVFEPTCSGYGREAIERYGAIRGVFMTWRRIRRCRGDGRHKILDPVPVPSEETNDA